MPKKSIRRTTVEVEEIPTEKRIPFGQLIDRYINETEYDDVLDEYQYQISVQKYNEDGRPITQTGRVYENLRDLPEDLGKRFGPARYRLFFQIYKDGKKVGFHRILDAEFDYDGDIQERHNGEEGQIEEMTPTQSWTLEQIRFAHEKELKQMEMNKEMFIAMMNAKGSGGGLKSSDVIDLIQTGVAIASGRLPQATETTEDPDSLMNVLNNPLLKGLLGLITPRPAPTVAGPSPPPAGEAPKIE